MNNINPFCPNCKRLLKRAPQSSTDWEYYNCSNCNYGEARLIGKWLETDYETNELFYEVARKLRSELNLTIKESLDYSEEFYLKFTNKEYCTSIGIKPCDNDFFHYECFHLLFYISYFIINKKEPDINRFREWYFENR